MTTLIKIILALFILTLVLCCVHAAPPYYATIVASNNLTGYWVNSGDQVSFSFSGTITGPTVGPGTNYCPLVVGVNEQDLFTTPGLRTNDGSFTLSGTLVTSSTNLQVVVNYSSGSSTNNLGGTAFVLTNFNAGSNSLYLYYDYDFTPTFNLTTLSLLSPNIDIHDPAGAARNATNNYPWMTNAALIFPSNSFSLSAVTNQMASGGFWVGNSNGLALISLFLSNGVVRITHLAP